MTTLNRIYSEMARTNDHNLNKVRQVLEKRNDASPVSVDIQAVRPITNGYTEVSAVLNKPATVEEIEISFATLTDGKARVLDGSLKEVDGRNSIISFVAAQNVQSRPFTNDGFREISSTVAVDTQDRIWRIEGEGDARRLIQETSDDLNDLLQARRNRKMVHTAAANLTVIDAEPGDYICYLDTASGSVSFGVLYNTDTGLQVIDQKSIQAKPIIRSQILEAARENTPEYLENIGLRPHEVTAKLSGPDVERILTYLRKIWPGPVGEQMIARYRAAMKMAK